MVPVVCNDTAQVSNTISCDFPYDATICRPHIPSVLVSFLQRRVALDDAVGIYMGLSNSSLDAGVSVTDVMAVS